MKKKSAKLALATHIRTEEERKRWHEENDPWDGAEKGWRITPRDVSQRVHALRAELESYREQLEAVPFDIPSDDIPNCLDSGDRKWLVNLVEDFNPVIPGFFGMIDAYAKKHGCHESLDFNAKLFSFKSQCANRGFKIGVLTGAIFAGCSKEIIDRLERGLEFSVCKDAWITKD